MYKSFDFSKGGRPPKNHSGVRQVALQLVRLPNSLGTYSKGNTVKGSIVPGPTDEISQARVHRDVVVADIQIFIKILISEINIATNYDLIIKLFSHSIPEVSITHYHL